MNVWFYFSLKYSATNFYTLQNMRFRIHCLLSWVLQSLNQSLVAVGVPFLQNCNITIAMLSEETGKVCGTDLTTVYDFWSASNLTFPGEAPMPSSPLL
jgi:hypothetical protein